MNEYDRLMLRSSFESLFWAVIADLKEQRGYRLQELAEAIGVDKSGVSRWFSGNTPNWTLNTIADIANALNVELRVEAVDRDTGIVYTSQGKQTEWPNVRGPSDAADDGAIQSSNTNARKTGVASERARTCHSHDLRSRRSSRLR